ncbi:MAG: HAMP domain-containing histidine kinase, partial [Bacteroidia bacterium]|nr:HAMP domain-containing histidine kinase [Bacteroidia bacterium]
AAQFDNLAIEALHNTVHKVELSEEANLSASVLRAGTGSSEPMVYHDKSGKLSWKMKVDTLTRRKKSGKQQREMRVEVNVEEHKGTGKGKKWVYHRSSTDKGDVITENIFEHEDVVVNGEDVDVIKLRVDSERVDLKLRKMNRVMKRMVLDIQDSSFSIEQRIKEIPVHLILEDELASRGIKMDFNCAILDQEQNQFIEIDEKGFKEEAANKSYSAQLFPGDVFLRPQVLLLHFPNKLAYVWSAQWPMLSLSILFTLIVILAFAASVYQMLNQKKLSEIKNDFINNITHEFKTPIATISLAVDSLQQSEVQNSTDRIKHYGSIIKQENERLNKHVENILQLAVLDKGRFKFIFEKLDLNELIELASDNLDLQLKKSNAIIDLQFKAENSFLYADKSHMLSVFTNLIDNAIKYKGDEDPRITIQTDNISANLLEIKVSDNGVGMDESTSSKIFDDFYRKSSGNIHNVKGFGIGLSYVKAVLLAHEASIEVVSKPQKGSIFIITCKLDRQRDV